MHRYMYVCTYLLLEETVKGLHPTLAEQTEPLSKEVGGRKERERERERDRITTDLDGVTGGPT